MPIGRKVRKLCSVSALSNLCSVPLLGQVQFSQPALSHSSHTRSSSAKLKLSHFLPSYQSPFILRSFSNAQAQSAPSTSLVQNNITLPLRLISIRTRTRSAIRALLLLLTRSKLRHRRTLRLRRLLLSHCSRSRSRSWSRSRRRGWCSCVFLLVVVHLARKSRRISNGACDHARALLLGRPYRRRNRLGRSSRRGRLGDFELWRRRALFSCRVLCRGRGCRRLCRKGSLSGVGCVGFACQCRDFSASWCGCCFSVVVSFDGVFVVAEVEGGW